MSGDYFKLYDMLPKKFLKTHTNTNHKVAQSGDFHLTSALDARKQSFQKSPYFVYTFDLCFDYRFDCIDCG